VYESTNLGETWARFGQGLPNAQVHDLQLNTKLNILAVGTHGRGMWEILENHLNITAPGSATAGSAFSITVTAQDANGNTIPDYAGTVHFTSSDSAATLPGDYTFTAGDNGSHTFPSAVTLRTSGRQTITATDTLTNLLSGSASITVTGSSPTPAPATHLGVTAPANATAGQPFSITVTAFDANNNAVPAYTGTVHFTCSAGSHQLPVDYTFTSADKGVHTFSGIVLGIAGSERITVTDIANSTITGSAIIRVGPGAAAHLSLSAPSSSNAGSPFTVKVTALDSYNNTASGYLGTIHFTSSDGAATLPANYTFVTADYGVHSFTNGVTLRRAGSQTVTATDTVISSIQGTATVNVTGTAAATHFGIAAPSTVTAGIPYSLSVTALDASNNPVPTYTGTVHFTASAGSHQLPADYTFTAADKGVHTFNGLVLGIAGVERVTVTDTVNASLTGNASIRVNPGAATHLSIGAPSSVTAGAAFTVTVTALDSFNNRSYGYLGTIHFTSSDLIASLPANYTFITTDYGVHTFTNGVTLNTVGPQTITATDTVTQSISGMASVNVTKSSPPPGGGSGPGPLARPRSLPPSRRYYPPDYRDVAHLLVNDSALDHFFAGYPDSRKPTDQGIRS
jgi:hypothetical protein